MKKIFSVLLAVAMLCTMSISAFAATVDTTGSKTSTDLQVKYVEDNTDKQDAYAASITWESMIFTYTSGGQKWNTDKMIWEDNEGGTWSSSKITIKNRSSKGISVTFKYTSETDNKGVDGYTMEDLGDSSQVKVMDGESKTIYMMPATAGNGGDNGFETTFNCAITPFGVYTGTDSETVKVGTITIALGTMDG